MVSTPAPPPSSRARPETARKPRTLAEEIGKRRPFELAEVEVYLNVMRTAAALSAPFAKLFADHGLSQATYNVLRIVLGHHDAAARGENNGEGGVPTQTIARQLVSRGPDVTRLVDKLADAEIVRRRRCDRDRRVTYVAATDKGRQLGEALRPLVDDLHRRQLRHLRPKKLAQLNALLFAARHAEATSEATSAG